VAFALQAGFMMGLTICGPDDMRPRGRRRSSTPDIQWDKEMKIKSYGLLACPMTGSVLGFAGAVGAETVMQIAAAGVVVFNAKNVDLSDGLIAQITDRNYVLTGTEGEMAGQSLGGICDGLGGNA